MKIHRGKLQMERKEIDLIIFDLDGTLIDSSDDIAWAANKTLVSMGYNEMDIGAIKEGIGWGVKVLLEKLMPGDSANRIVEAREKFLEYYWGHLTVHTTLYPGVRETLAYFKRGSKKMAVVTNKPVRFTERILMELDLQELFIMAIGGDSLPNRKPHPEPLEKVITTLAVPKERTVFVGDSPIDCETGKKAGVYTIGVEYGFRDRSELEDAGFDMIIREFSELKKVIK